MRTALQLLGNLILLGHLVTFVRRHRLISATVGLPVTGIFSQHAEAQHHRQEYKQNFLKTGRHFIPLTSLGLPIPLQALVLATVYFTIMP